MTDFQSTWRATAHRAQRHEPAEDVGGPVRECRSGMLDGDPEAARRRRNLLAEIFYWLAIVVLGGYAIFWPLLPEGGPL